MSWRHFMGALVALSGTANAKNPQTLTEQPYVAVTIDRLDRFAAQLKALRRLPGKPAVRVVFDFGEPPSTYRTAVTTLAKEFPVVAEPVDSYVLDRYDRAAYQRRFASYVRAFRDEVSLWEVGNEVNGEWSGKPEIVAAKVRAAADIVAAEGGQTMLTIYFNTGCAEDPAHEWKRWVDKFMPAQAERERYAFVGFSFYQEDCPIPVPDWKRAFDALGKRFPKSTVGFSEIGAEKLPNKVPTMKRYYRMLADPPHERFVGGFFWWQFSEDALDPALLQGLVQSMTLGAKR